MPYPQFPKDFTFGAATAAFQIEGASWEGGKGPSIWDKFSHTKGKIRFGQTADVACDHYHRYPEDVAIMKDLGLSAYRFSIAWPRIYPEGEGLLNQSGLDFYKRLADELLAHGITPFATLFHWDLPLALQNRYRGFQNRRVAELFADYTETVVKALGDRIKHWITINEPFEFSCFGHFLGAHAPGGKNLLAYFRVMHNILLAHGLALERIKAVDPASKAGIVVSITPVYPQTNSEKDRQAALIANQFMNHITLAPLYKGAYPEPFWRKVRLIRPTVASGDMEIISRPTDFIGINNYQREFASFKWYVPFLQMDISGKDIAETQFVKDGVQHTSMGWEVYPNALYEALMILKNEYGNPPVYITENGAAYDDIVAPDGTVDDPLRVEYLASYLSKAQQAVDEGADLRGYFVWSLIDNFEWAVGFTKRFGIVHVDHQTQKRTIKKSGYWYRDMIKAQKE